MTNPSLERLIAKFPCRISTRSKSASKRLRAIEKRTYCDAIHPLKYECQSCGCVWDDAVLTDYREVVCSNCYSERVLLVLLRLSFYDCGEQNGGRKEQRGRYNAALKEMSDAE